MRTLGYLQPEDRARIAMETLDIYAPLAGRLGISRIKDELEDLSLKHLQPRRVRADQAVRFRPQEREGRIRLERVKEAITAGEAMACRHRHHHRTGPSTSTRSTRRRRRRGKQMEEITTCWACACSAAPPASATSSWGSCTSCGCPSRADSRTTSPCRSPTATRACTRRSWGSPVKIIEIQIRTQAMHQTAENGIAAHWLQEQGAEGRREDQGALPHQQAARMAGRHRGRVGGGSGLGGFPGRDQEGAPARLDLRLHAERRRGRAPVRVHRDRLLRLHPHRHRRSNPPGAKADGAIIPLKEPLKNTQVVEIMTSKTAHPHLDWLRYVKTSKARSRIKHWLTRTARPDLRPQHRGAQEDPQTTALHKTKGRPAGGPVPGSACRPRDQEPGSSKVSIRIGEERNIMIRIAQCCTPPPGIHRRLCLRGRASR